MGFFLFLHVAGNKVYFVNFREPAMSMNSMYPDGWFAPGAAALKVNCVM